MAKQFPKESWYAVGGAESLAPGDVAPVRLFGEERVAWRGEDGKSHVWDNRCIHRGMRLQYGFVDGNRLACRYHGWRFGGNAQCEAIPAHPDMTPPNDYCIPAFQSVEKDGLIWTAAGRAQGNAPDLPASENMVFCRSVMVRADAEAAARHLVGAGADTIATGLLSTPTSVGDVETVIIVAVQPVSEGKSQLHVLASHLDPDGEIPALRLHVSAWARRLRDSIEEEFGKEAAT